MLATSGAKVSVGVAAGFIASLNVTALLKVPVPTSASVITRSFATTLTTVGFSVSMATLSEPPVPGLPVASV